MKNKIEIDVTDYLSKEEIKDICVEIIRNTINKDTERILSNLAYTHAHSIIDSLLTMTEKQELNNKVKQILDKTDTYTVFRKADYWHKEDSIAQKYLNESIIENKEVIKSRALEAMNRFDFDNALEQDGMTILQNAILDKLKGA